jgi:alkylation response protein AidB-like acyl-CoA dehydrogenase
MDFGWSDELADYKQAVVAFANTELNPGLAEREKEGQLNRDGWSKCADFGIIGLPFPKQYGGSEVGIMQTMLAMEGLGYGTRDLALIFGINAQMWSVQMPLLAQGNEAQKQKYLAPLIKGEIIAGHCMSEPDSGSDAYSLKTTARRCEGGYLLNGVKTWITNGPDADIFLVFASTAPEKKMWGISAFLVERGTPGLTVSEPFDKMGLRTIHMGCIELHDCFVPEQNRLGSEGTGAKMFSSSMEWERSCILASQIGAMERQLEESVQFAKDRRQFDQPIGKFQSVSNRIVDMKVRLETARLMLYKVAWLKSQGKPAVMEATIAKLYLSECFVQSSMDAIRINGARGYLAEFGVEQDLRDSIGGLIYSGTNDIQRNIVARMLGL